MDQIVVDRREPRTLVRFWAGLLGGEPVDRALGWSHVQPLGFPRIAFQPVPEGKAVKSRLHLDIAVEDIDAAVAAALRLDAIRVGERVTDEQGSFQLMLDPQDNGSVSSPAEHPSPRRTTASGRRQGPAGAWEGVRREVPPKSHEPRRATGQDGRSVIR